MTRTLTVCLSLMLFSASLHAREGMWMPQQLPEIADDLKAAGLKLDPSDLTELTGFPLGAVVSLGGCSASFVSPKGLVVTNHHCVYGSIQYNTTPENNLLQNGFLAASLSDEVPASPGSRVYVTVGVDNVTKQVIDERTSNLNGRKRLNAIENNEKSLVSACEADAGHRCDVYSYYGGESYYLIKRMEIRDVRLVYAPPMGVGKYGGDTDNWMWPRHTGDFGFYRAYVGPDGRPADYSDANIPFQPEHVLTLDTDGVAAGDFVMLAGYPGRTNRHRLPSEIEYTFGWSYPAFVKLAGDALAIVGAETDGREDAAIKYASFIAGVNNYYKNRQGMLDSYANSDMLERKQALQTGLKTWVDGDRDRRKTYASDIKAIESLLTERDAIAQREYHLAYGMPTLLEQAQMLYRLSVERDKPDAERKAGYQDRDMPRIKQRLEALERRYDRQVDQALSAHFMNQYLAQPKKDRDAALDRAMGLESNMSVEALSALIDPLYAGSELGDTEARLSWLSASRSDFQSSDDAMISLAVKLFDRDMKREARDEALSGDIQQAYAGYMAALKVYLTSQGEAVYPDANSTLRITYGEVTGRDAGLTDGTAWTPFTSLRGVVAKHTGEGEFDAPDAQLAAIENQQYAGYDLPSLNSVPVNFLATLDITGGNSGSAVLNDRAELVGLAFDGTLDSIISDWDVNEARTRSIQVDVRYMLWQMDVVDQAHDLLREMGVTPASSH